MKKEITRKEFISKTGKCVGGFVCAPMAISLFQSCDKPDPMSSITDDTLYISECPCHHAQFDQDGNVIQNPDTGDSIESLTLYSAVLNDDESLLTITDDDGNEVELPIAEDSPLLTIGGVSSLNDIDFESKGLLLYRKSQSEVIVLSRRCTHDGCKIGGFESTGN